VAGGVKFRPLASSLIAQLVVPSPGSSSRQQVSKSVSTKKEGQGQPPTGHRQALGHGAKFVLGHGPRQQGHGDRGKSSCFSCFLPPARFACRSPAFAFAFAPEIGPAFCVCPPLNLAPPRRAASGLELERVLRSSVAPPSFPSL
jgi:hypothetical protein